MSPSNIAYQYFTKVVTVENFNSHLPVCLQGNPAHRPDMRVLNMESAAMVVVLSAKKHIVVDATLLDKESILTALNVKGMYGDDLEAKIRSIGGGEYFLSGLSSNFIILNHHLCNVHQPWLVPVICLKKNEDQKL